MELKPLDSYKKPAYSSFQMKCGRILPAGLAVISAVTLLGGCDDVYQTSGIPPVSAPEYEFSATDGAPLVHELEEYLEGIDPANLPPELLEKYESIVGNDPAKPEEVDPELEFLAGDIAYVEYAEE